MLLFGEIVCYIQMIECLLHVILHESRDCGLFHLVNYDLQVANLLLDSFELVLDTLLSVVLHVLDDPEVMGDFLAHIYGIMARDLLASD